MSSKLYIAPCDRKAVSYACKNWHYSKKLPASGLFKLGVWEHDRYVGCVLYSRGANPQIGRPFNLDQTEICELTRIALTAHQTNVSRIISISLRQLKKANPGIKAVVSYADQAQNHLGIVYQASNWFYLGEIKITHHYLNGRMVHLKTFSERYKGKSREWINANIDPRHKAVLSFKYKYIYVFDPKLKASIQKVSKPYPKKIMRAKQAMADTHSTATGATPDLHAPAI